MSFRFRVSTCVLGFAAVMGVLFAGPVQAQISLTDTGNTWLWVNQPSSYTTPAFSLSSSADVLVVEISSRTPTAITLSNPGTVTYGGMSLTPAAVAPGGNSVYTNSEIFYLYNPPTGGTADKLVVNLPYSEEDNSAINAFTLGGVNTAYAPGSGTAGTEVGSQSTLSLTVTGVAAGSCAVDLTSYHQGSGNPTFSASISGPASAGATLNTSGSAGGNGQQWYSSPGAILLPPAVWL